MKIAEHALTLQVEHEAQSKQTIHERLDFSDETGSIHLEQRIEKASVQVSLSQMARDLAADPEQARNHLPDKMQLQLPNLPTNVVTPGIDKESLLEDIQDVQLKIMEKLLEKMFGRKINIYHFEKPDASEMDLPPNPNAAASSNDAEQDDFSLLYQRNEHYEESEKLMVTTQAIIKTEDGQEINIDVQAMLSRQFVQDNNIEVRAGRALKDPLVINFNGELSQLSNDTILFDIDADGEKDEINRLDSNSAYLALDKNNNGAIDNGSELFGATTGDGFKELSAYDDDENGVIDANDKIYVSLKLFTQNADGTTSLQSVSQAGLGAIFLDAVEAPFQYKDQDNQLQGALRNVSLGLMEDYDPVFVQQIDLAI